MDRHFPGKENLFPLEAASSNCRQLFLTTRNSICHRQEWSTSKADWDQQRWRLSTSVGWGVPCSSPRDPHSSSFSFYLVNMCQDTPPHPQWHQPVPFSFSSFGINFDLLKLKLPWWVRPHPQQPVLPLTDLSAAKYTWVPNSSKPSRFCVLCPQLSLQLQLQDSANIFPPWSTLPWPSFQHSRQVDFFHAPSDNPVTPLSPTTLLSHISPLVQGLSGGSHGVYCRWIASI